MKRRDALRIAGCACIAPQGLCAGAEAPAIDAEAAAAQRPWRRPAVASRLATRSTMLDITAVGPRLVAVGERGRVLLSDDGGRGWRQARAVPVSVTLTAVTFVDAHRGWATGHAGTVLHTADGGETWALQLDGERAAAAALATASEATKRRAQQWVADGPDKPLLGVAFRSPTQGLVVGAYGLILSTADGGATWVSRLADTENPKGLHLNGVAHVGGRTWIAGERGLVLRADGDGVFAALPPVYDGSWFAIDGSVEQGVTLAGLRGNAYRCAGGTALAAAAGTTVISAGTTAPFAGTTTALMGTAAPANTTPILGTEDLAWQRVAAGEQTIVAVRVLAGRTLLVGQDGAVRLLVEGGATARRLDLPAAPAPITALALTADGGLVAATLRGPLRLADRLADRLAG